jgi:hypothetical protein
VAFQSPVGERFLVSTSRHRGGCYTAHNGDRPPADESPAPHPRPDTPDPSSAQPRHIEVDDSKAVCAYANFCRVTGTPEELIIDFGLNTQPVGIPTQPIAIHQRIVLNF